MTGEFYITSNPRLASFDGLTALRRIRGEINFSHNAANFDYSGLANLQCHGGLRQGSASNCPGCPSRLINLPRC